MEEQKKKNFFISYTSADSAWAKWINWVLRDAGYSTIIDYDDFAPGQSFIRRMHDAVENAERMIAVLSPEYFKAKYTGLEWESIFANDPSGQRQLLIPVRAKSFTPPKFFTSRIYIDLVDVQEEQAAKDLLLNGVRFRDTGATKGNRSSIKPPFPNDKKDFPVSTRKASIDKSRNLVMTKLGQLDRKSQLAYLHSVIPKDVHFRKGQTLGFIVCGPKEEWPESISYRLNYLIASRTATTGTEPELIQNNKELIFDLNNPEDFLWEYLSQSMNIVGRNLKKEIKLQLEQAKKCHIFSRRIQSNEAREPELLVGLLTAWQKIKLKASSPSHFLLLICESERLHAQIDRLLEQDDNQKALLPPLATPVWSEIVDDWLSGHFDSEADGVLIDAISNKVSEIKSQYTDQEVIPLLHLREHFREIFFNHRF